MVGEWNDGGFETRKFGPNFEGPDLWLDVKMPAGVNRLTFYNFNGATTGADRRRDYVIEIRKHDGSMDQAQSQPILARARVVTAQNTAYRTFLLSEGKYWVRIASRYSHMAGLTAVFFDRADAMAPDPKDSTAHYLGRRPVRSAGGSDAQPERLPASESRAGFVGCARCCVRACGLGEGSDAVSDARISRSG